MFNFWVYDGEQIIKPKNLRELDTTEIITAYGNKIREPNQKYRDLLKRCNAMRDGQNIYVLLGIELQLKTHYAMPARNMLYEAINFSRQVEDIANAHRKDKTQHSTSDELDFLN